MSIWFQGSGWGPTEYKGKKNVWSFTVQRWKVFNRPFSAGPFGYFSVSHVPELFHCTFGFYGELILSYSLNQISPTPPLSNVLEIKMPRGVGGWGAKKRIYRITRDFKNQNIFWVNQFYINFLDLPSRWIHFTFAPALLIHTTVNTIVVHNHKHYW